MKKFILTLVAACALAFSANAQFYAGGSIGFNLASSEGVSGSAWHIAPGVGYKFTKVSSAGLYFVFEGGTGGGLDWSVRPYYRFTFANVNNIHFFGAAEFKIGQVSKATQWGIGLIPGIAYSISNKFDILAQIGYIGVQGANKNTAFCFNLLKTAAIGVEFKF